jgi:hypothetical protein
LVSSAEAVLELFALVAVVVTLLLVVGAVDVEFMLDVLVEDVTDVELALDGAIVEAIDVERELDAVDVAVPGTHCQSAH